MDQTFTIQGTYSQTVVGATTSTTCTLTYQNPGGTDVTMQYTGVTNTDVLPQIGTDVQSYIPDPVSFCQNIITKGADNLQTLYNLQRDLAKDQDMLAYIQQDLDARNASIADKQAQINALQAQLNALVSPQPQ